MESQSVISIIRQKMRECGVWNLTVNTQIYTTEEFLNEFGDKMPNDLKELLKNNISHLQYYCDDRILVPKSIDKKL